MNLNFCRLGSCDLVTHPWAICKLCFVRSSLCCVHCIFRDCIFCFCYLVTHPWASFCCAFLFVLCAFHLCAHWHLSWIASFASFGIASVACYVRLPYVATGIQGGLATLRFVHCTFRIFRGGMVKSVLLTTLCASTSMMRLSCASTDVTRLFAIA